jgi:hypothetical protein
MTFVTAITRLEHRSSSLECRRRPQRCEAANPPGRGYTSRKTAEGSLSRPETHNNLFLNYFPPMASPTGRAASENKYLRLGLGGRGLKLIDLLVKPSAHLFLKS